MRPALPHSIGEQLANILNDFESCESLYLETKACECIFFKKHPDITDLWLLLSVEPVRGGRHSLRLDRFMSRSPFIRLPQVSGIHSGPVYTVTLTNNIQHGNETEEFWERKEKQIKRRNKL